MGDVALDFKAPFYELLPLFFKVSFIQN